MKPHYPFQAPANGQMVAIDERIKWLRMQLPVALDHINIYLIEDDDGVTIVDTGMSHGDAKERWAEVIKTHIHPAPIKRVLATHYHPDHIGLAGWFVKEHGAELWTSRMSYLLARMLQLDHQERPAAANSPYWARAGYDAAWIEERMNKRPFNFLDTTEMLPLGVHSLLPGEEVELGGRKWQIRFGQGHAPDHVTLWSEDLVIIGDHCLPAITPVISSYATEPRSDPLAEFTGASKALAEVASDEQLFLPGHNRPFHGGRSRLLALVEHHESALDALREALVEPKTMIDCYPLIFNRKITPMLEGFAISEATAHFNHLERRGEIESFTDQAGVIRWRRIA